jgi:hypothetical protein
MSPIKNISIPEPCHQSWQQMTVVDKDRHCRQCCKIVTDFTAMSNDQILTYLSINKNVCGRFEPYQLNTINRQLHADKLPSTGRFKGWMMAISLLGSTAFLKAGAQTKAIVVQTVVDSSKMFNESYALGKIAISRDTTRYRIITGHIIDQADNTIIPGVTIAVTGTNQIAQTNANGEFRLRVSLSTRQLEVKYIGYIPQTIKINDNKDYTVKICMAPAVMGEVVVIKRPPFFKRIYYRFIKRPIRKLFS